jgi:hypothetical protein
MKLLSLTPSLKASHKYLAVIQDGQTQHAIHFGGRGYMDYIQYYKKNPEEAEKKKAAYIARHSVNEPWTDPLKPGTLARYILWNKPTLRASTTDFKKRFGL